MAALGSDASWLAAAGTPAPLSVRPPDESLFSLLSQHPMLPRQRVRPGNGAQAVAALRGGDAVAAAV
eukprot:scaffold11228_cov65-Phaeocystis_antarctica.AAC.4